MDEKPLIELKESMYRIAQVQSNPDSSTLVANALDQLCAALGVLIRDDALWARLTEILSDAKAHGTARGVLLTDLSAFLEREYADLAHEIGDEKVTRALIADLRTAVERGDFELPDVRQLIKDVERLRAGTCSWAARVRSGEPLGRADKVVDFLVDGGYVVGGLAIAGFNASIMPVFPTAAASILAGAVAAKEPLRKSLHWLARKASKDKKN